MHLITYVPLLSLMVMAGTLRFGQEAVSGARLIVATQQELREAVGGESEAARMIKAILAERLTAEATGRYGRPPLVSVVAEQLAEAWLPAVAGIRIERVTMAEARAGWERGCLSLLRVSSVRTETTLTVTVTEGHRCASLGGDYLFDRTAQGWVRRGRIGGGFGGIGDCGCGPIR